MKNIVLVASILLSCMYFGSAWAVDLTLFEQDFLRGKGKPDSFAESFVAQEHQVPVIICNGGSAVRDVTEGGESYQGKCSYVTECKKIFARRSFTDE